VLLNIDAAHSPSGLVYSTQFDWLYVADTIGGNIVWIDSPTSCTGVGNCQVFEQYVNCTASGTCNGPIGVNLLTVPTCGTANGSATFLLVADGGDNKLLQYTPETGQLAGSLAINDTSNGVSDPANGFLFNVIQTAPDQIAFVDDTLNTVSFINISTATGATTEGAAAAAAAANPPAVTPAPTTAGSSSSGSSYGGY